MGRAMKQDEMGWPAMACVMLAFFSLFAIPIGLVSSALQWLVRGYGWTTTMAELLDNLGRAYPVTNWVGLQRIIDWYMVQRAVWAAPAPLTALFSLTAWSIEFFRKNSLKAKERLASTAAKK